MDMIRSSGVLLHVTSLPGPDGIGDLGPEALQWVDRAGSHRVPLLADPAAGTDRLRRFSVPVLLGFAGNPYLVASQPLLDEGAGAVRRGRPSPVLAPSRRLRPSHPLEAGSARPGFRPFPRRRRGLAFRRSEAAWLDDFALFMALKDQYGPSLGGLAGAAARPPPGQIERVLDAYREEVERHAFRQWLFHRQWESGGRIRAGFARDRRHPHLCRPRLGGRVGEPRSCSSSTTRKAHRGGRGAARLLLADRTAVGQSLPTGTGTDTTDTNGGWAGPVGAVAGGCGPTRPLPRLRRLLNPGRCRAASPAAGCGPRRRLLQHVRAVMGDLPIIAEDLGEITPTYTNCGTGSSCPVWPSSNSPSTAI